MVESREVKYTLTQHEDQPQRSIQPPEHPSGVLVCLATVKKGDDPPKLLVQHLMMVLEVWGCARQTGVVSACSLEVTQWKTGGAKRSCDALLLSKICNQAEGGRRKSCICMVRISVASVLKAELWSLEAVKPV